MREFYSDLPTTDESTRIAGSRAPLPVQEEQQYATAFINDRTGNAVEVFTEGPQAGRSVSTGELVLQESPEYVAPTGGDGGGGNPAPVKKLTSTYTDPETGDIVDVYDNGDGTTSETVRKKGMNALNAAATAAADAASKRAAGQSAYDILYNQFNQYGLGSLVKPLQDLIKNGASTAEMTMALRQTPDYQRRFAGNAQRIANGLAALDEATYLAKEDAYQNIMRNYGLPDTYWKKDDIGTQEGFTKLIANDVSATELESRIQKATDFIDKGPKAYVDALKQFYPEVNRGDLLAYVLDPKNALTQIQSKIGAAKIGGEYINAGLTANQKRAEELQRMGITAEQARTGAQSVKDIAPRGSELAAIYQQGPYGQTDVEEEVYGLGKAAEAKKKRQKLVSLETASFGARSGVGALDSGRAGAY